PLDKLAAIDRWLFHLINGRATNPVLDAVMPFITEGDKFIIPLAAVWFFLFWKADRRGKTAALVTLVVIAASDQFSAHVLKPLFSRQRPPYSLEHVTLLVDTTRSFSFPSVHASNAFAVASFVSSLYRRGSWPLYIVACLIAYSRVYVGVHFPFDVLGGTAVGLCIGFSAAAILKRVLPAGQKAQVPDA
ncbi:MAG: phosphatase PAP2 family protein, partial [Candidatus Eisenbacteria bacterium]